MLLRLSALEYLGVVTSRLRKDAVQSKLRIDYIDSIVTAIREEEEKEGMNIIAESDSEKLWEVNYLKKKEILKIHKVCR